MLLIVIEYSNHYVVFEYSTIRSNIRIFPNLIVIIYFVLSIVHTLSKCKVKGFFADCYYGEI